MHQNFNAFYKQIHIIISFSIRIYNQQNDNLLQIPSMSEMWMKISHIVKNKLTN